MSEPEKTEKKLALSKEQKSVLRQMVDRRITDAEFYGFIYLAEKYGLDPFLHEIWIYKAGKEDNPDARTVICVSRDGYLAIAQKHPEYVGPPISFAVCEGDEFQIEAENYRVHHRFGSKRGQIIGAWARCDRKGKTPAICFVPLQEYAGKSSAWLSHPSAMIQKVAEAFVLKRQFGISGLVTREEMDIDEETSSISNNDAAASRPTLNVIRGGGHREEVPAAAAPAQQPETAPIASPRPAPSAPQASPQVAGNTVQAPLAPQQQQPAAQPQPQKSPAQDLIKGMFYLVNLEYPPRKDCPGKVYARLALKEHPQSPKTHTAFIMDDALLAELAKYDQIEKINAAIGFMGKIPVIKEFQVVA